MKFKWNKNESPLTESEAAKYLKHIGLVKKDGAVNRERLMPLAMSLASMFCASPNPSFAEYVLVADWEENDTGVIKQIQRLYGFYREAVPRYISAIWVFPHIRHLLIRFVAEDIEIITESAEDASDEAFDLDDLFSDMEELFQ